MPPSCLISVRFLSLVGFGSAMAEDWSGAAQESGRSSSREVREDCQERGLEMCPNLLGGGTMQGEVERTCLVSAHVYVGTYVCIVICVCTCSY